MTWNYRITRVRSELGGEQWDDYAIREVYYDQAGTIKGWSKDAMAPYGETQDELAADLELMTRAIILPVLDLTGEQPVELPRRTGPKE